MKSIVSVLSLIILCALSAPSQAQYKTLIGYPELQGLLGAGIPDGTGIAVQQVESVSPPFYMPDVAHAELLSTTITNESVSTPQGNTGASGHATSIGRVFYGTTGSIAPGISTVSAWEANHWLSSPLSPPGPSPPSFLKVGSSAAPSKTASIGGARIANHSWVGDYGNDANNLNALRRIDYIVEQDDFIQVVGIQNGNNTGDVLLKTAFNVISVGRTDGVHHEGTYGISGSSYTAGRTAPHLVAPGLSTSGSTPMVSASVALLLESGNTFGLTKSNGTIANATRTIFHAETSEVIKATLMAGADRMIDNLTGADLTSYVIDTGNNLDLDYGAGQMNVYHNYLIQSAGEQESDAADIGDYGWDYDEVSGTDDVKKYAFTASSDGTLFASLVWNSEIVDTPASGFSPDENLYNLDLLLYDVTSGEVKLSSLGASSESTTENTENVYFESLVAGNRYELRVIQAAGQAAFDWDFGLAWRTETVPEPTSGVLLMIGLCSALLPRRGAKRS